MSFAAAIASRPALRHATPAVGVQATVGIAAAAGAVQDPFDALLDAAGEPAAPSGRSATSADPHKTAGPVATAPSPTDPTLLPLLTSTNGLPASSVSSSVTGSVSGGAPSTAPAPQLTAALSGPVVSGPTAQGAGIDASLPTQAKTPPPPDAPSPSAQAPGGQTGSDPSAATGAVQAATAASAGAAPAGPGTSDPVLAALATTTGVAAVVATATAAPARPSLTTATDATGDDEAPVATSGGQATTPSPAVAPGAPSIAAAAPAAAASDPATSSASTAFANSAGTPVSVSPRLPGRSAPSGVVAGRASPGASGASDGSPAAILPIHVSTPVAVASPTITGLPYTSPDDGAGDDGDDTASTDEGGANGAASQVAGFAAQTASAGASASSASGGAGPLSATTADLAAQMAAKLASGGSRFQVQLNPLGLGRVDVQVTIGVDREVRAQLSFADPAVANALHAHAAELQGALQQAGFNVPAGGMQFSAHSTTASAFQLAGGGLGFGAGSHSGPGGGSSSGAQGLSGASAAAAFGETDAGATAASAYGGGGASGQLDIRI